jgi:hypothetical protein
MLPDRPRSLQVDHIRPTFGMCKFVEEFFHSVFRNSLNSGIVIWCSTVGTLRQSHI